jgi:hypothetical protein
MHFTHKFSHFLRDLIVSVVYTSIVVSCGCKGGSDAGGAATPLEDLQRSFVELRFGMFLHFGGDWPANALMNTAAFAPVAARYVRLEATAANGTPAAATEVAVGARR